eukprot:scaffold241_cov242-Pinguiococcus_pyrenoidosus.AAC.19
MRQGVLGDVAIHLGAQRAILDDHVRFSATTKSVNRREPYPRIPVHCSVLQLLHEKRTWLPLRTVVDRVDSLRSATSDDNELCPENAVFRAQGSFALGRASCGCLLRRPLGVTAFQFL